MSVTSELNIIVLGQILQILHFKDIMWYNNVIMSINPYSAVVKTFAGNGKNSTANGAAGASSLARPYIVCPVPDT